MTQRPKRLLVQVRDAIRLKHYAYSTEETYVYWAKRFVLYHNKRHPLEMGQKEISEFLTYLAVEGNVAAWPSAVRWISRKGAIESPVYAAFTTGRSGFFRVSLPSCRNDHTNLTAAPLSGTMVTGQG